MCPHDKNTPEVSIGGPVGVGARGRVRLLSAKICAERCGLASGIDGMTAQKQQFTDKSASCSSTAVRGGMT